jgi:hypothetical protein
MTEKNVANNAIGKGGRVKLPSLVIVNRSTVEPKETYLGKLENYIFGRKENFIND